MSGHNKWSQIKNRKGAVDKKRGQLFSKLSKAITIAAKSSKSLSASRQAQFNPQLRAAIEKAKENQVPQENIERAIKKASEVAESLEELLMEAYGPEGAAILIEAVTDSRNRTVAEIKKILKDCDAKWADSGSVLWAFENIEADKRGSNSVEADNSGNWQTKFPVKISEEGNKKLQNLIEALDEHDDVINVITNVGD